MSFAVNCETLKMENFEEFKNIQHKIEKQFLENISKFKDEECTIEIDEGEIWRGIQIVGAVAVNTITEFYLPLHIDIIKSANFCEELLQFFKNLFKILKSAKLNVCAIIMDNKTDHEKLFNLLTFPNSIHCVHYPTVLIRDIQYLQKSYEPQIFSIPIDQEIATEKKVEQMKSYFHALMKHQNQKMLSDTLHTIYMCAKFSVMHQNKIVTIRPLTTCFIRKMLKIFRQNNAYENEEKFRNAFKMLIA